MTFGRNYRRMSAVGSERASDVHRPSHGRHGDAGRRSGADTAFLAGNDYSIFMDASWFPWVTETWRTIVPPNVLLIGLLTLFEAAVGALILIGGRMTQLGLIGAIAFHLAMAM